MSISVLPVPGPIFHPSFGREENVDQQELRDKRPIFGPSFGREESVDQQELRDRLDGLDINGQQITDLKKPWEEEVCDCCLINKHWSRECPYTLSLPADAKIGSGWRRCCKRCFKEEFYPDDEFLTCKKCGSTRQVAIEKLCGCCDGHGHLEEDCEYRHLVDWSDPSKLYSFPYADPAELEKERKKKSKIPLEDGADGRTRGMLT